ncbi:MAG: [FeFe] hydrogenase H-cluster maturation GTPase HydF, partial [Oscillospiraceae bacterium]|nr:[FeFe] hydrogenase H-cluster maturation GTPase HydF [Oscillospiraceae bacterium]
PPQHGIRDVLESDAAALCVKEFELRETLERLKTPPALVVTDSQVFARVSADVPPEVPLTSFSILMARYKGLLAAAVQGAATIDGLRDGDRVLMAEGCTHHRQCDDIGSVKIPRWLRQYTGRRLEIETTSGRAFPEDLSPYRLVIHCGGCMLNEREVRYRMKTAQDQQVPITNYGVAIACMQGILRRSIAMFPHLLDLLEGGMR